MAVQLNKLTKLPIIGISHTGHLFHDDINEWNSIGLKDQIAHKIKYIENHLHHDPDLEKVIHQDKQLNLILVGHSIGCYVILELLGSINPVMKSNIKKAFLLFPTVERMAVTPNGKILHFITNFFLWFVHFFSYLITLLPDFLHTNLVDWVFTKRHLNYVKKTNDGLVHNASKVVSKMCRTYSCAKSCLSMGRDEMNEVKELKKDLVIQHKDILLFYYGTNDRWCPISYYYEMREFINEEDKKLPTIILDSHGMEHSFIIFEKQCNIISSLMHEWINQLDL
jgi:hypothetical protein